MTNNPCIIGNLFHFIFKKGAANGMVNTVIIKFYFFFRKCSEFKKFEGNMEKKKELEAVVYNLIKDNKQFKR
jgi:hypothetical protein